MRLGAKIKVEGQLALVEGTHKLTCAHVEATDLRGGAALVVAALAASGTTTIDRAELIERGYEDLAGCLNRLGAAIKREE